MWEFFLPPAFCLAPTKITKSCQEPELAASVERNSEHPLAEVIVRYAQYQEVKLKDSRDFAAIPGSGVQAIVDNYLIQIGTQRWMTELGIYTTAI